MIQRVELNKYYDSDVHCIFCGKKVVNYQDDTNPVQPCEHTLFVASDEGFDYRSKRFDEMVIEQNILDDSSAEFEGYDHMTDLVQADDAIKIAQYVGAPSGMGSYVGFAPNQGK